MNHENDEDSQNSGSFDDVIFRYWQTIDSGEQLSREQIIAQHPELAGRLKLFFEAQQRLQQVVPGDKSIAFSHRAKSEKIAETTAAVPQDETLELGDSETRSLPEIKNHKLIKLIDRGGMGIVYLADQLAPLKRKVAVKLIRPGLESAGIVARFRAEQQALAMLNHAQIAKIYDVGITDDGRPFFVMEWVDGIAITKFCNQQQLSVNERIRLMVIVCQAVDEAHRQRVLHRDIKPANILVRNEATGPTPKLIDFGMAKAMGPECRLTDETLLTQYGGMVGTPNYVSPEQSESKSGAIERTTDVYSLGIVLYELLTGTTPLESSLPSNASRAMILDNIQNCIPLSPSALLDSSPELLRTASSACQITPQNLIRELRGDLDWVVLKAIEKEPHRRYHSASEMANDLQRFLNYQSVEARPPSVRYRVNRFVRRNRLLVGSAALIAATMLLGFIFSLVFALSAREARDKAIYQATRADAESRRATAQAVAAEEARQLAESNRARLSQQIDIIESMFSSIASSAIDDDNSLREELGKQLVETARLIGEVNNDEPQRSSMLNSIGHALGSIGLPHESLAVNLDAWEHAREKLPLAEQLDTKIKLAGSYNSVHEYHKAIELLAPLIDEILQSTKLEIKVKSNALNLLTFAFSEYGELTKSLNFAALHLELLHSEGTNLGDHLATELAAAEFMYAKLQLVSDQNSENRIKLETAFRKIELANGKHASDTISCLRMMAENPQNYSKSVGFAEEAYRRSEHRFGRANNLTALCLNTLVVVHGRNTGKPGSRQRLKEVLPLAEEAIELLIVKLKERHPDTITILGNIAAGYGVLGDLEHCIEVQRRAVALAEEYYGRDSEIVQTRLWRMADALSEAGQLDEASELITEYLQHAERSENPNGLELEMARRVQMQISWRRGLQGIGKVIEKAKSAKEAKE